MTMQCVSSFSVCNLFLLVAGFIAVLSPASASPGQELVTRQGRHIRLITDLPDTDQLSGYIATFDAAVPLWAQYLQHDAAELAGWRVTAYLMSDKAAFAAKGLVPASLPDFRNGYQAGTRIWVVSQPSEYYTRHLLLHEGVHAITSHLLGGSGPPWYMEGTAEFLGTHLWEADARRGGKQLRIGLVPPSPEAVPQWGRIELIARGRQNSEVPTIETVMRYSDTAHREVDPYAWSWLAVTLLEMYPQYQQVLRSAASGGADSSPQFTRALYHQLQDGWPVLSARWRLLALDMEYGFDPDRHRVELPALPLLDSDGAVTMPLDVARGWQSAPFKLAAGQAVEISAGGRFNLRQTPQPWISEAEGVTIEYHRGWPLGRLLACVLPTQSVQGRNLPELKVVAVGELATVEADEESWLLMKINEPAGALADNEGTLELNFAHPEP